MRHVANFDTARPGVGDWIEQVQLARSLSHHQPDLAIWSEQRMVRRSAGRNPRDDLVAAAVQHLNGVHTGLGEEDLPSVRADVQRARRVIERNRAGERAAGDVDDRQGRGVLLLAGGVDDLAVGGDGKVVRLRNRRLPDELIAAGVDRFDLVRAEAGNQDEAAVRGDGKSVRRGANLDAGGHLVAGGVDDGDLRVAIATGVQPFAVGSEHHPVWAGGNRNRLRQSVC